MKIFPFLLLLQLVVPDAPGDLQAAIVQKLPWCAEGAGYDSDKNGILDGQEIPVGATACTTAGTGAANFATEGTGYAVKAESGILAGTLAAFTDATADGSSAIKIPAGAGNNFLSGQARYITPTLGAGDHYAWVRIRTPDPGASTIWMSTSPLLLIPSPSSSLQTSVGAQTLTYSWVKLTNVVAGGARREIYITTAPSVELDCIYLDTLANPPPSSIRCPGGTSAAGAEYVMLRTTGTPASCSDVSTANPVPFTGFTSWNNTVVTAKMVWKDASPDRIYGCIKINDTNLNAPTTGTDQTAIFSNDDYFELVIKSNTDSLNDATKTKIAVNINAAPSILDAHTTATGGSDLTYAANCSVVRTIVGDLDAVADDTSWEIFYACDLNANDIAQSQLGKLNILIKDNDGVAGTTTKAIAKGGEFDINQASAMMTVLFDTNTIPPPADVTGPTVGTPTLLLNGINQQTWRFTCSDAGSGCASGVLDWDINSGTPYANSTVATLAGGNYDVIITGLTANTPYFVRGRACDAAGNCTNGAEANSATLPSTATIFAMQGGTGTACSVAVKCSVVQALTNAVPGSIIELLGDTPTAPRVYTGASAMIAPPAGKSGTSAAPITVRASCDGCVRIDGQGARTPISLSNNNDWFVIEGFNAHNSSGSVVLVSGGSDDNIIRRVVAWNALISGNSNVFAINGALRNTLEDVAGFGTGRKIITTSFGGNFTTVRRAWTQWECSTHTSPKASVSHAYDSYNNLFENIIATWNQDMTACPGTISQPESIFNQGTLPGPPWESNSVYLGSIGYITAAAVANISQGAAQGSRSIDGWEYRDVVLFNVAGTHTGERAMLGQIFDMGSGGVNQCAGTVDGVCTRFLTNISAVGWSVASSINAATITQTNLNNYATVAAMNTAGANPFQTTSGTGARVCFRYLNGTLTGTKLWPWPMNQRIIDAMTQAGKTPVDVTATIRSLLGTTAACE